MSVPVKLTMAELQAYRNQGSGRPSGKHLRFYCPIHGGDHQRSLSLDPETGRFRCFACGAWGYLKELGNRGKMGAERPAAPIPEPQARPELTELLARFQKALPGSGGAEYLRWRRIPLDLAQAHGVGYAAPGCWPHKGRDWRQGRLVFPHTNPAGQVVNLYGRAVGGDDVPKETRHDHLPGAKGVFNAKALVSDTVFICEGVFDALSLMAAGYPDAVAIFGVDGLRWEWVRAKRLVFCLDQDKAGQRWHDLAWEGVVRGKEVFFLPPEAYAGCKDLNEAWVATGRLDVGKWEREPKATGAAVTPPVTQWLGQLVQTPAGLGTLLWVGEYTNEVDVVLQDEAGTIATFKPEEIQPVT